MSWLKWLFLSVFGGGIAFWIPDVIIPALDKNEHVGLVTLACPAVLMLFYFCVLRLRRAYPAGPSTAMLIVVGIWILAIPLTLVAQALRAPGGGYTWGDFGYIGYLVVSCFVPTRIMVAVVLEGSVFAMMIGTVAMITCHLAFETNRWILPPIMWNLLRRSHQ